jgi:hypothetical protein
VRGVVVLVASVFAFAAPARAVRLEVGYAEALPGDEVTIAVTLSGDGEDVAGTQNDIWFDADAPIAATAELVPDCRVNQAIDKEASVFAYQPPRCALGETCRGARALILSLFNIDPIPDGLLYTCQVALPAGAEAAPHFLHCAEPGASTPSGEALETTCRDGEVLLPGGTPRPTLPPTATRTPTPTPTPFRAPTPIALEIAYVNAEPGDEVLVDVVLRAPMTDVAGVQNDIEFPPEAPILATDAGRPDCSVNPEIDKPASAFTFLPLGCTPAVDCTGIRALVLALDNVSPIADGAVLYSCRVRAAAAPGASYLLTCLNPGASDPDGTAIETECRDGAVLPPGVSEPPRTPRPTRTPINDEERTRKPTSTQRPTATGLARGTQTPSADGGEALGSPTPVPAHDDDGCTVVRAPRGGGWVLLPFGALLWIHARRTRPRVRRHHPSSGSGTSPSSSSTSA